MTDFAYEDNPLAQEQVKLQMQEERDSLQKKIEMLRSKSKRVAIIHDSEDIVDFLTLIAPSMNNHETTECFETGQDLMAAMDAGRKFNVFIIDNNLDGDPHRGPHYARLICDRLFDSKTYLIIGVSGEDLAKKEFLEDGADKFYRLPDVRIMDLFEQL